MNDGEWKCRVKMRWKITLKSLISLLIPANWQFNHVKWETCNRFENHSWSSFLLFLWCYASATMLAKWYTKILRKCNWEEEKSLFFCKFILNLTNNVVAQFCRLQTIRVEWSGEFKFVHKRKEYKKNCKSWMHQKIDSMRLRLTHNECFNLQCH